MRNIANNDEEGNELEESETLEENPAPEKAQRLISTRRKRALAAKARKIRRDRARVMVTKIVIFVALPTLLAVAYYGFIATDMYQSISIFTVQSSDGRQTLGLESLLGSVTNSGTAKDSLAIKEFVLSRDMLALLEKKHNFIEHFRKKEADWWSRLNGDSSFEETFEYYLEQVEVSYDTNSSVLSMTVKAYSAEKAKAIAETILALSEEKVNTLSARARNDQIEFAKQEVKHAEERLATAQKALLKLQGEQSDLHPGQSAESLLSVRGKMEAELAGARTELAQARAIMRDDAPKVVALKQKVAAINRQITLETKRLVGSESDGLNNSIVLFESALMEKGFAEKEYQAAMASLTMAKLEAARQSRYLATIASPTAPDEATHPKRILGVFTVLVLSLAFFGIVSLLIAAVREHARV